MDGKSVVFRWIAARVISRSLTGNAADLARLIRLRRRAPTTVAVRRFFDTLQSSLSQRDTRGELFLRIGRQLSPASRRRSAGNLIYNEFVAGYRIRRAHSVDGPEYRDFLRPPILFQGKRPTGDAVQPIVLPDR